MNKSKIVLAAVGGVFAVLILGAGWFVYDAVAARDAARDGDSETGSEGLETILEKVSTLSRKSVFPCAESQKAIDANRALFESWKDEAQSFAARGDKVFAKTTPPAFKEFLIGDAKRLIALPGGVSGRIAKEGFAFGPFGEFITGAKMPPEKELATLQRQWDDLASVIELLSQAGVAEIAEVAFETEMQKPQETASAAGKKSRPNKKPAAQAKGEPSSAPKADRKMYRIVFNTRPAGLVKALNALTVCERFVVVDDFAFHRAKDVIAEALAGEKKATDADTGSRRRRRRAAAEENAPKPTEEKNGVITDPQTDDPLTVMMKLSVYDFGSLEEEKK